MNLSRSVAVLFLSILLFTLIGCSPFIKDGQPGTTATNVVLRPGETIGQTFTARDRGLNGIEIFLSPEETTTGELRLHLRADSQSTTDIATGVMVVQAVTQPGFYRFDFAPQKNSRQQPYFLMFELSGSGTIRIGTAPGDAYLDGALYQNDNPVDAQMAFRLAYDPVELSIGLAAQSLTWLKMLAIAIFLFVLPGWALLAFLLPTWVALSWGEKLGLAIGASIAIYPVSLLWTDLIGLHLGSLYAWLPPVLAMIALTWHNRAWRPEKISRAWRTWQQSKNALSDIIFVVLIGVVVGVRFWAIRSVDVPMWGDSYQHTMMTQLLIDHGGLFNSWQPYADLVTFTYHFGFHAASAMFHWVSGMETSQSVLWTGQILNVLAVIALYPLALRVNANRWAGVGAVWVAGLLSSMPMFYVNWGRYTQLAGQAVLPAAIGLAWMALDARSRDWRLLGAAWIVWGGLALTHYRILIFGVLFFISYFLLNVRRTQVRDFVVKIFWLGIGGAILFLPWFVHTFAGRIMASLTKQLTTPSDAVSALNLELNGVGELSTYLPIALWGLMILCIAWGLLRRDKNITLVSLWWLFILLAANPQWLRLPGEGALTNFAVLIAAYFPASILIGAAIGWIESWQRRSVSMALLAIGIVVGVISIPQRIGDAQPMLGALVTPPDLRAAAWIQANTPTNAYFLVNSFFAYNNMLIVGADGGWWLPLLAHRQTILPPLTYGSEQSAQSNYREWINAVPATIQKNGIGNSETLALLKAHGVTHVYIGQRQGHVNNPGMVLEPEQLQADEHFRLVYHQDRVWIFELRD